MDTGLLKKIGILFVQNIFYIMKIVTHVNVDAIYPGQIFICHLFFVNIFIDYGIYGLIGKIPQAISD